MMNGAVSAIRIVPKAKHPHSLSLERMVKLLLIKQLVRELNRMFANMLVIFSMIFCMMCSHYCLDGYKRNNILLIVNNKWVKGGDL